jgi:hypothetical protein
MPSDRLRREDRGVFPKRDQLVALAPHLRQLTAAVARGVVSAFLHSQRVPPTLSAQAVGVHEQAEHGLVHAGLGGHAPINCPAIAR